MSWSYSGDPSTSDLDEVRFYIQDTQTADQLLSNEEVNFLITKYAMAFGSNMYSASVVCKFIAAKFAREVNFSGDGVSMSASDLQQKYATLAENLYAQYKQEAGADGGPDVGGIIWGEELDWDIKPLNFSLGMGDNYEAGRQSYGGQFLSGTSFDPLLGY